MNRNAIRCLVAESAQSLNQSDSPRLDAEILLSHALHQSRTYLYSHPEYELNAEQLRHYQQLIHQRQLGVPIAYLTQSQEFWSLTFKITEDTLIPRSETELLVELVLSTQPLSRNKPVKLLELGTGSGAIAIAIASERPDWEIDACDKSSKALVTAKFNAKKLNTPNVHFHLSDWFKQLPMKQYDFIVSNPPYVPPNDPHLAQGDVRFEPQLALVSNQNGLQDIKCIIEQSRAFLKPEGLLAIEHGYDQKLAVKQLFKQAAYQKIRNQTDLSGNPRVTSGRNIVPSKL